MVEGQPSIWGILTAESPESDYPSKAAAVQRSRRDIVVNTVIPTVVILCALGLLPYLINLLDRN